MIWRHQVIHHDIFSYLTADVCNLSFQITNARFSCVVADNIANSRVLNRNFIFFQAMVLDLFRNQVVLRNMEFFLLDITFKLDDFHTIQQRSWNRVQAIRRCDEHNFRKIVFNFKIVILEC
ncbi:hypothetical protein D3C72_2059500 [compost metagenome]